MDEREFLRAWLREADVSQWRNPASLWRRQQKAAEALLLHAKRTVPFYAKRLDVAFDGDRVDWSRWADIPILERSDVLTQNEALRCTAIPESHGSTGSDRTSGSSGIPVDVYSTRRAQLASLAIAERGLAWHGFDGTAKMAFITPFGKGARYPDGAHYPYWTELARILGIAGELACLDIITPINLQIDWLRRERPRYLHTFPSNAAAIARHLGDHPIETLEKVLFVGETVSDETREICRRGFQADIVDRYGSVDGGPIAMQCPTGTHYHVQCEAVLLEVLDADGKPVGPGGSGRVVVTNLLNYAMPFIRYRMHDHVELGPPCACGRGLPVINRILGRERHMFRFPDGTEVWPRVGQKLADTLLPLQWQVAQVGPLELEIRFVPRDRTHKPDYAALTEHIRAFLGQPLEVRYKPCESLGPTAGGKFHDYVCEL